MSDVEPTYAELKRLVAYYKRQNRQIQLTARNSERMSERSKRVMSRAQAELRETIARLETTMVDLQSAKLAAEAGNEAKGRFLAVMSHEIRTPMNGVLGAAELLSGTPLGAEQREFLDAIRRSGDALVAIINDVLDYSRIDAGRLTLESIEFPLVPVLDEVLSLYRAVADTKGVALVLDVARPEAWYLNGDPLRLKQVISNLVDNALKFTESGSVTLSVHAETALTISVTDTGVGIPADQLERIFDEFSQADDSTTRKFGGSGLGLSICRHIVTAMRGRLLVSSKLGKGTTFSVELPFQTQARTGRKRTVVRHAATRRVKRPQTAEVELRSLSRTLLVVDDNPINRMVASRLLERSGFQVVTADDGIQALQALVSGDHTFAAILLDVSMPNLDGFGTTAAIRHMPEPYSKLPIIAMTAHALGGDRQRCIEAGMDEHLPKPIAEKSLLDLLALYGIKPVKQPAGLASPELAARALKLAAEPS